MPVPGFDQLLKLQECDATRLGLEQQLAHLPREVASVEAKIAAEKSAIETAKAEWRELEAKKKTLETEIGSAEGLAARYRTQQSQVKKNDEYRALTHEIETTEAKIGGMEEEELKIMYAIDEAKRRFAEAEAVLKKNIAGHEGRIRELRAREAQLQAEHRSAVEAVASARPAVPEDMLTLYDRILRKPGMPVCAPVQGGRCGGCHMKASSNVEFEARKADKIVTCDQCSRIVYWVS
jgi:hypothetical protein